jgi:hypothetical protein
MASICVAALFGCGIKETPQNDATQSAGAIKTPERFEGFAFELPDGWIRVEPDQPTTRAMLLLGAERWNLSEAMIKVDVGKPVVNDCTGVAKKFADDLGGAAKQEAIVVDGEKGIRVTFTKAAPTLAQPTDVVVMMREGRLFLIMGAAKSHGVIAEPLETIIRSWQWE